MSATAGLKFDDTLGPMLLGGMFAMALWGITCVQTFTFFTLPRRDRPFMRILIFGLWLLDTLDTALIIHLAYHYMVSNFMNISGLFKISGSVILHVTVTATSNFTIRALFAHRIYRLSNGNLPITGWIMTISSIDLVSGLIITVKAFRNPSFLALSALQNLFYLTFAAGTGADLSVTIALTWLLRNSRTGFKSTDGTLRVLMLYTVNTGFIVAVDAALGMFLYIAMPKNFIFLGFYLLLSKLYLNSYLATMNARHELREKLREPVSIHLSDMARADMTRSTGGIPTFSEKTTTTSSGPLEISIHTETTKSEPGRAY